MENEKTVITADQVATWVEEYSALFEENRELEWSMSGEWRNLFDPLYRSQNQEKISRLESLAVMINGYSHLLNCVGMRALRDIDPNNIPDEYIHRAGFSDGWDNIHEIEKRDGNGVPIYSYINGLTREEVPISEVKKASKKYAGTVFNYGGILQQGYFTVLGQQYVFRNDVPEFVKKQEAANQQFASQVKTFEDVQVLSEEDRIRILGLVAYYGRNYEGIDKFKSPVKEEKQEL